jgi:hypothetical protein
MSGKALRSLAKKRSFSAAMEAYAAAGIKVSIA